MAAWVLDSVCHLVLFAPSPSHTYHNKVEICNHDFHLYTVEYMSPVFFLSKNVRHSSVTISVEVLFDIFTPKFSFVMSVQNVQTVQSSNDSM